MFARPKEMMRRSIGAMAIVVAAAVPALPAEPPDGLIVVPGALDVVRTSLERGQFLEYYVRETYPATSTLAFLRESLAKAGWRPATGADLAHYESSSLETGWRELPGGGERLQMRVWSARWLDSGDNEVTYTLVYSSPLSELGLQPTSVGVAAWYRTKEDAGRFKSEIQAEIDRVARSLRERQQQRKSDPCQR
jgi:hypothetical protein